MIKDYIIFMNNNGSDIVFNLFGKIDGIKNIYEYIVNYYGNSQLYELYLKKWVDHINGLKDTMATKIDSVKNQRLNENGIKNVKNVYGNYIEVNVLKINEKGD